MSADSLGTLPQSSIAPACDSSSPQKITSTAVRKSPAKIGTAMPQVMPSACAAAVRRKYEPSKTLSTIGRCCSQAWPGRPSPRPKQSVLLIAAKRGASRYRPPPHSSIVRSVLGTQTSLARMKVFMLARSSAQAAARSTWPWRV